MKKSLLSILCLTIVFASKAQEYYPSGNIATPTWSYSSVVSDNNGNYYNPVTNKNGNVMDDATLQFTTFNRGDAYDGVFEFFVKVQDSVYTESGIGNGGVDTTGTAFSMAEQLIDGFYVSKSYFFSPNEPVVRAAFKIRNPSDSARFTKIGIYSNMGSDGSTIVDTSFTDVDSLVDADRWMVTTDGASYSNGDPINSWVRFGPGPIVSSPVFGQKPEASSDNYLDTFNVVIPANSYRYIFQFNRMDSTAAAARTNIVTFNSVNAMNAAGYLDGMTGSDLMKVVNWNFSSLVCDTAITTIEQSICEGSFYTFNGNDYSVAGSYPDTLTTINGCDSIINLVLTVNALSPETIINASVCEGSAYTFHGNDYTIAGSYSDTLSDMNGCDSIVTLVLTVNALSLETTVTASVCEGSAYTFNGSDYLVAGTYTDTLTNMNGCDSIVTLELSVYTVNTAMTLNGDMFTAEETNGTYQWIDCATNTAIDSATAQTFVPSVNGSYAVVVTVNSCSDTSDCIEINNLNVSDLSAVASVTVSPNPGNGQFVVTASQEVLQIIVTNVSGQVVADQKTADFTNTVDIRNQPNGIYFVKVIMNNAGQVFKVIKK